MKKFLITLVLTLLPKIDVPPEIVTIIEEQQDLYPGVFIDTKPVRNISINMKELMLLVM